MKAHAMLLTLLASTALLGGCATLHDHALMGDPVPEPMAPSASADVAGAPMAEQSAPAPAPAPQPRRGFRMGIVARAPFHKGTVRAGIDWSGKRPDGMIDVAANVHPLPAAVELRAQTRAYGPSGVALDVKSPMGHAEAGYGGAEISGASE